MQHPRSVLFRSFLRALFATFLLFSAFSSPAEIIYDNTATFLNGSFSLRQEYGDQVDLEGNGRQLTQILFEYFGRFEQQGDERVKVRLYSNETPYDNFRRAPTTLLFESDWIPLTPGYSSRSVSGLNLRIPFDTVTVTFEFDGITEDEAAGLLFYDAPTVGYSFNEVWVRGATGLWAPVLYSTTDPMKRANIGMRLVAESEVLVDQQQLSARSAVSLRGGTNLLRIAQTFTPSVSGRLSQVNLSAQFTNLPMRIQILDSVGQKPGPNVLGARSLLTGRGNLQTNYLIDDAIYLRAGTTYTIELSSQAGTSKLPSYVLPVSTNANPSRQLWSRDERGGMWSPMTLGGNPLNLVFETHIIPGEPPVQIVSPRPSAAFDLTEFIFLEAALRETNRIARVRFYRGTQEIGVVTNAPYAMIWSNAPAGEHMLRAIAEDIFRRPFRSERVPILVQGSRVPSNDRFARRQIVNRQVAHVVKPSMEATIEPDEPRPLANYSGKTLWWSWTAYDDAPVTISAANSSTRDNNISVYLGSQIDKLFFVTNGNPELRFSPEPGKTYSIVIEPRTPASHVALDLAVADNRLPFATNAVTANSPLLASIPSTPGRNVTNVQLLIGNELLARTNKAPASIPVQFATSGFFNVTTVLTDDRGIRTISDPWPLTVRPSNDDLRNAIVLTGTTANVSYSSVAATRELHDPVTYGTNTHSVWYKWTAPARGQVTIDTVGRRRPGNIGVYIAANSAATAFSSVAVRRADQLPSTEFFAEAGVTYILLLVANHGEDARFELRFRPPNGSFAERAILRGPNASATFHVLGGQLGASEPNVPNLAFVNRAAAWWTWTAPASGPVRVDHTAASISVYTGNKFENLALSAQRMGTNSFTFFATEGRDYHFRAIDRNERGNLHLQLTFVGLQMTRPLMHQFFTAPATIPLAAEFVGGAQTRPLEFFANGSPITNLTIEGGTFLWTNVPAGTYEVRARATDATHVSAPTYILVSTNVGGLGTRLFAGPYSRTSFVKNESGEVIMFGKRPAGLSALGHSDPFYPATLHAPVSATGWDTITASASDAFFVRGGSVLYSNLVQLPYRSPRADAPFWTDVSASSNAIVALGVTNLFFDAARQQPRPLAVTNWLMGKMSSHGIVALGSDGETYLLEVPAGAVKRIIPRPAGVQRWIDIDSGHNIALLQGDNGEIYSIHFGTTQATNPPALVTRPAVVTNWIAMASGGHHQLFLAQSGALYAMGRNLENQLGLGWTSPTEALFRVPFPQGVTRWLDFAAGEFHSLALGNDCNLYTWGSNADGQLGLGRYIENVQRPTRVEGISGLCLPALRIREFTRVENGATSFRFDTALNRTTYVEYSQDLVDWQQAANSILGDGFESIWTDSGLPATETPPGGERIRFYRLLRD